MIASKKTLTLISPISFVPIANDKINVSVKEVTVSQKLKKKKANLHTKRMLDEVNEGIC